VYTLKVIYAHPMIGFKGDNSPEPAQIVTMELCDKLSDTEGNRLITDLEPIRLIFTLREIDTTLDFLQAAKIELIRLEEKIKASGLDVSDLHNYSIKD